MTNDRPYDSQRPRRGERTRVIIGLIAVLIAVFVFLAQCGDDWGLTSSSEASEESSTTAAPTTPTTSSETTDAPLPAEEETADVVLADGSIGTMQVVAQGPALSFNTRSDTATPPAGVKFCGYLKYWHELYDCQKDQRQYVDGVNRNKSRAGFDWDHDVAKWAAARDKNGKPIDSRYIVVIGISEQEKSKEQALAEMRGFLPDLKSNTPVVYRECVTNTRHAWLEPFLHCRPQVRVNLAPLVMSGNEVVGYRNDAGFFVDCYNENWLEKVVRRGTPPPPAPPQGNGTPPPRSTPPRTYTTPPRTTTTTPPVTTTTTPPVTTTTTTPCTEPCCVQCETGKTNTPNPSQPPGWDPQPTYGPEETVPPPPPATPAPPPAQMPSDAPAPEAQEPDAVPLPDREIPTQAPELPSPTATETVVIVDPGSMS